LSGDDVQPLAHVLADPMQRTLAAGARLGIDIDRDLDPWQMCRQRAPVQPAPGRPLLAGGRVRIVGFLAARCGLLDLLQPEQKLVFGQLLRPVPEPVPLQLLDDLLQPRGTRTLRDQHRF
jgi:hypothetical protein